MEITVRVEVQYNAPAHAEVRDMLRMFRTPVWVRFMVRYISPHLKNCAPANKDIISGLRRWRKTPAAGGAHSSAPTACVICMYDEDGGDDGAHATAVELPCGHSFHESCIESWLKMRSTCPTCRHQLPKAFSGCYAVRTLNSALLLKDEQRHMPKDEILKSKVGKEPVRAIVNVTLGQVAEANKQQQFPCVLNALMAFANGEVFHESDMDKLESTAADLVSASSVDAATTNPSITSPASGRRRLCDEAACSTPEAAVAAARPCKRARV